MSVKRTSGRDRVHVRTLDGDWGDGQRSGPALIASLSGGCKGEATGDEVRHSTSLFLTVPVAGPSFPAVSETRFLCSRDNELLVRGYHRRLRETVF